MSEMVEKVARAIYASHPFNNNHDSLNPGFDGLSDDWRGVMFANARAAIAAMREPTAAMKAYDLAHDAYVTMIDAALTPPIP
jgi:hypothetical protein